MPESPSDLYPLALEATQAALSELLADPANSDLAEKLPADFAERVLSMAWQHQSEIEKARFRREARLYFEALGQQLATGDE